MGLIDDVVEKTLMSMSETDRQQLILSVVDKMIGSMSPADRLSLMERVIDRFLEGLPPDERRATVRELVPRLMSQMMHSGGMSVDDLLGAAIGSLGSLESGSGGHLTPTASE